MYQAIEPFIPLERFQIHLKIFSFINKNILLEEEYNNIHYTYDLIEKLKEEDNNKETSSKGKYITSAIAIAALGVSTVVAVKTGKKLNKKNKR